MGVRSVLFRSCVAGDVGFVADVGLRDRDAVAATERLARGVEAVLVDVHQHHAGALAEEPLRDRLADAAGTAGDDGDLVLQAFHGYASVVGLAENRIRTAIPAGGGKDRKSGL